jgi:hypothetical protein
MVPGPLRPQELQLALRDHDAPSRTTATFTRNRHRIAHNGSYFEPVRGSAPSLAERGLANPMATFLTVALLLDQLGLSVPARQVRDAVRRVRRRAEQVTYDLGGTASTMQSAAAVSAELATGQGRLHGDPRDVKGWGPGSSAGPPTTWTTCRPAPWC